MTQSIPVVPGASMNSLVPSPISGHRRRPRAVVALVTMGLLLASACGSSGSNEPQATGATSETSSPVSGNADTGDGGSESDSDSGDDDASTPTTGGDSDGEVAAKAEPGSEEPSAAATPVSAELAHDCVPPGGTQTITITSEPKTAVGYQTVYSDGTKGSGEKTFSDPDGKEGYGGNNGGLTDESGRWKDTWTVSVEAPEGPVEVAVFAMGREEMGGAVAKFEIADTLGSCD